MEGRMRTASAFAAAVVLAVSLGGLSPAAADYGGPSVPRQPTGPADWATFTPQEQAAARAYMVSLGERLLAAGQLPAGYSVSSTTSSNGSVQAGPASADHGSAYGRCTITTYPYPGGSWTQATATTYTSTTYPQWPIYYIDTGNNGIYNDMYKNGAVIQYFGSHE